MCSLHTKTEHVTAAAAAALETAPAATPTTAAAPATATVHASAAPAPGRCHGRPQAWHAATITTATAIARCALGARGHGDIFYSDSICRGATAAAREQQRAWRRGGRGWRRSAFVEPSRRTRGYAGKRLGAFYCLRLVRDPRR